MSRSVRRFGSLTLALLTSAFLVLGQPGISAAAPPGNDDFANATSVTEPLPFTDSQDTSEATTEVDEPQLGDVNCGFGVDHTVWYSYTPSADVIVSANTFGSDFDTVLGVWTGADLASLDLVGCVDDTRDLQSSVVFLAEMGTEYFVQIGGYGGDTGALEFKVRETAAGFIGGTVTDEDTTDPIQDVCAVVFDAAFGDAGVALTDANGEYRVAVRPGEYLVQFIDCGSDSYVPEWWDDSADESGATEIAVADGDDITGVDAALTPGCPGFASFGDNQVLGTAGDDTLAGTAGEDVICGFGGDDSMSARAGDDIVLGGAGADTLRGADGSDALFGGAGRDFLLGGLGRDFLSGGTGRDVCDGGDGHDRVRSCETRRNV